MPDDDDLHAQLAASIQSAEAEEAFITSIDAYRARLLAHGYSETAAEQMVVTYHATSLALAVTRATREAAKPWWIR